MMVDFSFTESNGTLALPLLPFANNTLIMRKSNLLEKDVFDGYIDVYIVRKERSRTEEEQ